MNEISSCPTYHRILETSVRLVKNGGFDALTVRRVSAEAGVNIAAVNYHFKSKENLLDAVFGEITAPFVKQVSEWVQKPISPREKLQGILLVYVRHLENYPTLVMRNLTMDAHKFQHRQGFIQMQKAGFEETKKLFIRIFPELDEAKLSVVMMHIFGAITFMVITSPIHQPILQRMGLSLPCIEEQIAILLDNYIKK